MPLILPGNVGSATAATGYDVANSCRFNDGSSDHLLIAPSSSSNKQTWTWSAWVKRGKLGTRQVLFSGYDQAAGLGESIEFTSGDLLEWDLDIAGTDNTVTSSMVFRDVSAWYHILFIKDVTESTETNRIKVYVNGVQIALVENANGYPAQNATNGLINAAGNYEHHVGCLVPNSSFFDGYMCEVVFIDGTAQTNTDFGEFDSDSGIWKPIDVSGLTFGTNGFYLPFLADGTNAGFVDFSSNNYAVTRVGSTIHSFAQAKFDSSSIYFDGSGDALTLADGNQWDFGTGDYTLEFWVNKAHTGKESVFETRGSGGNGFNVEFNSSNVLEWYDGSITGTLPVDGSAVTANTWVHFALVRASNVHKMYRNGTEVGTALTSSSSQVSVGGPNIGRRLEGSSANDYTGYLDEIRLSTVARYTSNFTAPSASFVSDSDTRLLIQSKASNLLGGDNSGKGNHFTTNNLTAVDQSTDTCTNNFATLNILDHVQSDATYSEGNLKWATTTDGHYFWGRSTIGVSTGKWYAEFKATSIAEHSYVGIVNNGPEDNTTVIAGGGGAATTTGAYEWAYKTSDGQIYNTDGGSSYGNTYGDGAIIGVLLNLDDNEISFSKDGTVQNSGTAVSITAAASTPHGFYFLAVADGTSGTSATFEANFGSPPYAISSGNADANGHGNFEYAVPSGYLALCTKNLAENG